MSRLIKAKFIQVSICFHLSQSPFCVGALLAAAYAKKKNERHKQIITRLKFGLN